MSEIPNEFRYASTHEWARLEEDGTVTIGITDHAQGALGDVVYVELPEAGLVVAGQQEAAVVESVKAASDIYAPIAGTVVAVNEVLEEAPETVNEDPYGSGWFFRLQPEDAGELDSMLTADAYGDQLAADEA